MEQWFRGYGVDGFLFHPSYLPGGLDDFVELVVPELQSRGAVLFRAEYEGTTLREKARTAEEPLRRLSELDHAPPLSRRDLRCGSVLGALISF